MSDMKPIKIIAECLLGGILALGCNDEVFDIPEIQSGSFQPYIDFSKETRLIMEFYPAMNTDWLIEFILLPELDLNELPGTSEIVSTGSFQWEISSDIILPNGMLADLAMAESADGIHHVTMLSKSTDYHRLYDDVFLPAVNTLSVVETRNLKFSHTEGLALFTAYYIMIS